MFKSAEAIFLLDTEEWEYKIIDSEFEETGRHIYGNTFAGMSEAITDMYERKGLNVAANLVIFFLWISEGYTEKITDVVQYCKQNNPKFAKYEDQINKLLILI